MKNTVNKTLVALSVLLTSTFFSNAQKSGNMRGSCAVMVDKMNVFYIGVDNPVTIATTVGWDKTDAAINNGSISGSGSKRTVRVNQIGVSTITVIEDGIPTTFNFRVKRIPDPIFKIGSGKTRMTCAEFKAQLFCRADIENFDFDVKFKILSATVRFSGAGFAEVVTTENIGNTLNSIKPYLQRCMPGSSISFESIKVEGPDGVRTIDDKTITLY